MKDAVGNDLAIGDKVVYLDSYARQLKVGHVKGFTPKMVVVGYQRHRNIYDKETELVDDFIHRYPEIVAKV